MGLPLQRIRVIHVMAAQSVAPRRTMMTTFTIDRDNNITAFASAEEAATATSSPFDTFSSQEELAQLIAGWPNARLTAVWNSLPGVTPVKRLKNSATTANRIWGRIQGLAEAAQPETEPVKAKPQEKAQSGNQRAKGARVKSKTTNKASRARSAPKAQKAAQEQKTTGPREGSKTAQVVAMLRRKGGATLAEISKTMLWQAHTVRGFMAGSMKKAGCHVQSFKSARGERTYRITQ
jgi:hypothetical protein